MNDTEQLVADCHCGGVHPAEYHHDGRFGEGAIYISTCPTDYLAEFWTTEGVRPVTKYDRVTQ